MVRVNIVTLFPELIEPLFNFGVISRAVEKQLVEYTLNNPRDFAKDTHHTVDDRPYGGGDGMVMLADTLAECMASIDKPGRVIYLTPQGSVFDDKKARELSELSDMSLICGRYAGVDQRFINKYVDEEISIGDFVVSGGEPAANVVIDSVVRQIPGVLGHSCSSQCDSFANGILEGPCFSKPRESLGQNVPDVLLSGNHAEIATYREQIAICKTIQVRPEIFISDEKKDGARKFLSLLSHEEIKCLGLNPELFNRQGLEK